MEADATTNWLRDSYFEPGRETIVHFVVESTAKWFYVYFSPSRLALIPAAGFIAGALWIIWAGLRRSNGRTPAALGLFLFIPFGLNALAGLLRLYPYGGSRHCVYLLLFVTAGISWLAARTFGNRLVPLVAASLLAAAFWHLDTGPVSHAALRAPQDKRLMTEAISFLRESVPRGQPIVVDHQSGVLLTYYLGDGSALPPPSPCGQYDAWNVGGYRLLTAQIWSDSAARRLEEIEASRSVCGLGQTAWNFDVTWGGTLMDEISRTHPHAVLNGRRFGPIMTVFQLGR